MRFPRLGEPAVEWSGRAGWPGRPITAATEGEAPGGGEWPPISIVTPSLNQAATLEATILSVANQGYPSVEHIVVDGGSSDGTVELLERHPGVRWTSAPDRGQADAVNAGLARARGQIVGWLNADDYYEPGALRRVAEAFLADRGAAVVYGDCFYLYEDEDVTPAEVRLVPARRFDLDALLNQGCYVHQPATFLRASALPPEGLDESLRYALDYEYWLRLATRGARFVYLPAPLATFRITAASKSGAELERFWPEVRRVSLAYGGRRLSAMYCRHLRARLAARLPRLYRLLKRAAGRGATP